MITRFNFLLQVGLLIICTFALSAAVAVLGNETNNAYSWILASSCAILSFIGLAVITFMIFRTVHRTGSVRRNMTGGGAGRQPRNHAHNERPKPHWHSLGQSPYGRYRMYNRKRHFENNARSNYQAPSHQQSRLGKWHTHRERDGRNFEDIGRRK